MIPVIHTALTVVFLKALLFVFEISFINWCLFFCQLALSNCVTCVSLCEDTGSLVSFGLLLTYISLIHLHSFKRCRVVIIRARYAWLCLLLSTCSTSTSLSWISTWFLWVFQLWVLPLVDHERKELHVDFVEYPKSVVPDVFLGT